MALSEAKSPLSPAQGQQGLLREELGQEEGAVCFNLGQLVLKGDVVPQVWESVRKLLCFGNANNYDSRV